MQKLHFSLILGLFALFTAVHAQDTTRITVLFDNDSHLLTAQEQNKLKQQLPAAKATYFYITGHTDGRASDAYNEALAARRVKTVRDLAIQLGISPDSLKLSAFGERKPIASNKTDTGRAQNRRVEVYWITQTPQGLYTTIEDLYRKIEQQSQIFWLRADQERDTIIQARQGTRFLIPKGAFRCDDEFDYSQKIRFEVKEYITAGKMLQGNLHSMSEGKILQTGGMMHIAAFQGDNPIELCKDRPIAFFVPSENPMKHMYRFDGLADAEMGLDWRQGDSLRTFGAASPPPIPRNGEDTIFNTVHLAAGLQNHLEKVAYGEESRTFQRMVYSSAQRSGQAAEMIGTYGRVLFYGNTWNMSRECTMWDFDPMTGEAYPESWDVFTRYVENPNPICDTLLPQPGPVIAYPNSMMSPELAQLVNGASGYLGNTANLGYINCDRFIQGDFIASRVPILTDVEVDSMTDVKLIIPRVRGIMSSSSRWLKTAKNNKFSFRNVPPGLSAILMGLRYEEGKAYIAISRIQTSRKVESLSFEPIDEEEIPKVLAKVRF